MGVRENRVSVQILTCLSSILVCCDGTQPRLEFPSAFYHVMARGNRRESIFHDDDGRRFFLSTLSEACAMTGWRVHTWVLMGNHHYLFIETAEPNRVAGMSWWPKTSRCVAGRM
jgi:REP element-mobilizing transposase RayT